MDQEIMDAINNQFKKLDKSVETLQKRILTDLVALKDLQRAYNNTGIPLQIKKGEVIGYGDINGLQDLQKWD